MLKMTMVHLGVILFTICLSTQVACQNNTTPMMGNSTSSPNTTMATGTYSSPPNSTSPTGAGVSLQAGGFSFLLPLIVAASFLQRFC